MIFMSGGDQILTLSPPLGGEGMIFMSGGDQIPVMMVCDRINS
jgi:cyanophycinase-like exopeptidase